MEQGLRTRGELAEELIDSASQAGPVPRQGPGVAKLSPGANWGTFPKTMLGGGAADAVNPSVSQGISLETLPKMTLLGKVQGRCWRAILPDRSVSESMSYVQMAPHSSFARSGPPSHASALGRRGRLDEESRWCQSHQDWLLPAQTGANRHFFAPIRAPSIDPAQCIPAPAGVWSTRGGSGNPPAGNRWV
jgi:hypothetical protein